ncbi:MAG: alpha/beta family hydrolase, partial [Terriglobales bacterium]
SYGGRQASMLAADDPGVAAALLLLSYPLHPPRRPTQLRNAHFPQLRVPSLFVQGTRDEFASVEEITSALDLIPARTRLLVIEGAGHSLAGRRELPAVTSMVSAAFRGFIG